MKWIYVKNGAFLFELWEQLKRGVQVIHDHFPCFGLDMHVGKSKKGNIKASKTKCIYFLASQFFDNKIPSWYKYIKGYNAKSLSNEGSR